ncbi:hypothetical protein ACI68E_002124 [Malassezia pachydermatis]
MSHPVAMILAVSSREADPLNALAKLYEESSKGDMFAKHPFLDPSLLRCYVLVHDVSESGGDMSRCTVLMDEVRKTYGLQCAMLSINSGTQPDASVVSSLSAALEARGVPYTSSSLGAQLSTEDLQQIQAYVREMITKSLVPFLERSVHQVQEQVAAQRRGLTGRLLGASRKFFAARPTSASTSTTASTEAEATHGLYVPSSLAAQTRRLADLAVFLRDYRLAGNMYEAVRRDYITDQAAMYSACAAEMACVMRALHMWQSPQESSASIHELYMDAVQAYAKAPSGSWYALRCSVLYAFAQTLASQHTLAAQAYLRASAVTDELVRALLVEHAYLAYLRTSPPHTRKSAMTLLQAAALYDACGQHDLALQCYARTSQYYQSRHGPLYDHSLYKMALLEHKCGHMDNALTNLVPLLHGTSPQMDQLYLDALQHVASYAHPAHMQLPVPVFDVRACYIVPWGEDDPQPCVAGPHESFVVRLRVQNPLHIAWRMMHLTLAFAPADQDGHLASGSKDVDAVVATDGTLSLAPRECRDLDVRVQIASPGMARLARVTYVMHDLVPIEQVMTKQGPRLHRTPAQKRTRTYAPDTTLCINIQPQVPRLTLSLEAPSAVWVGEWVPVVLHMSNPSAYAATQLRLTCSPPTLGLHETQEEASNSTSLTLPWSTSMDPSSFSLPDVLPGAQQRVELAWHVTSPGTNVLSFTVSLANDLGHSYTSHLQHTVPAQVLLDVQTRIALACTARPAYVMAVEMTSYASQPLAVDQLALVSPQWRSPSQCTCSSLSPHNRTTLWLRLDRHAAPDLVQPMVDSLQAFFAGKALPSHHAYDVHCTWLGPGTPPPSRLGSDPHRYTLSRAVARRAQLQSVVQAPISLTQALFPSMDPHDVDLLVQWTLPEGRKGETLLCGTHVGIREDSIASLAALDAALGHMAPTKAMYAETAQEKELLRTAMRSTPILSWPMPFSVWVETDCTSMPTCPDIATVRLHLRNESPWPLACQCRWIAPIPTEKEPVAMWAPWVGSTKLSCTIPAYASYAVDAHVLADGPGVYQLGAWHAELTVQCDGQPWRTWTASHNLDALLTVHLAP